MTLKQPIPKKKRLRTITDNLWSNAVRDDWANRCAVCGRTSSLNAHHLIPRDHEATRYSLQNGICLCSYCHVRDPNVSPHENAVGWLLWLSEHWPKVHTWYTDTVERGHHRRFDGTRNAVYYCDVIRGLREYIEEDEFESIVGIRFAAWLENN